MKRSNQALSRILAFCILSLISVHSNIVFAQQENTDSSFHSPKKATLLSTFLPGAGQFYNRKYWKMPIIYAGLGTSIYFIASNNHYYNDFRTAYIQRTDENPLTIDPYEGQYNESNLKDIRDYYRRNMELSVIATTAIYLLNIVDAAVDAHLYEFSVDDDLSIRIQPTLIPIQGFGSFPATGFTVTLNLHP